MAIRIALEGLDGSGKRTQAALLAAHLVDGGRRVETVSFPRYGETFFSASVAAYLNGELGELAALPPQLPALLFAGDRLESREHLEASAADCDVLILDRYTASNLSYHAARVPPARRRAFIDWLAHVEHEVYGLPAADLTLYLRMRVDVSSELVARKGRRDYTERKADIHEADTAYLADCAAVYEELLAEGFRSRWQAIDCCTEDGQLRPRDAIAAEIRAAVALV